MAKDNKFYDPANLPKPDDCFEFVNLPEELAFVSKNKDGNYYFGFKVKVQRGIKGKTRSKVDELIIVGMSKEKAIKFAEERRIKLEN